MCYFNILIYILGSFTLSNELRYNTVNIISNSECLDFYGPSIIIDSTICQSGADIGSPCLVSFRKHNIFNQILIMKKNKTIVIL
jgi:hypothetical protein